MMVLNLFVTVSLLLPNPGLASCSVRELRASPDYRYSVERIRTFLDSAAVIVRARAVGVADETEGSPVETDVRFLVIERLRAPETLTHLSLPGRLVQQDDFNPDSVPYRIVRPAGQHGDCFAREYRKGAQYLLILQYRQSRLTPHWISLAPLNEQVSGPDDPWVQWVRAHLERQEGSVGGA